jgi:esterase/lipase superfamily enzyme
MTLFINLRATPVGGDVADLPYAMEASPASPNVTPVSSADFAASVAGRDIIVATHGFNVDQQHGIAALSTWGAALPSSFFFVGVLWPGDSRFLPVIDYVYEGPEATHAGRNLANYLNANATGARSITFTSHSLGARVILEAIRGLDPARAPQKIVLMAGAIENDCLVREYSDSASKVKHGIYVLASRRDAVLEFAFPIGNLFGQIIMHGHPYDRTALGREGPAQPAPAGVTTWQIPDGWGYGHGDYLPGNGVWSWKSQWSAAEVTADLG